MDIAPEPEKFRQAEVKKANAKVRRLEKKARKAKLELEEAKRRDAELIAIALKPLEDGLEEARARLAATNQRMVEFEAKVAARKNAQLKSKSI